MRRKRRQTEGKKGTAKVKKARAEMNGKSETDDTDTPTHREMKQKKMFCFISLSFSLVDTLPPSTLLPAQKWRGGHLSLWGGGDREMEGGGTDSPSEMTLSNHITQKTAAARDINKGTTPFAPTL